MNKNGEIMLLSEKVELKWNAKICKHYIELGYKYTKMGDTFEVVVADLTKGSNVKVLVECDYCKCHYYKHWRNYRYENEESLIHKDCCKKCKKHKIIDACVERYGVTSQFVRAETLDKIRKTNLEKYGAENPFASDIIKERIYATNQIKFGGKSCQHSEIVRNKTMATCLEKYGRPYALPHYIKERSPQWKGGPKPGGRAERHTYEYHQWRKSVFERDDYRCQACGLRSAKGIKVVLNAHHILNWKNNVDKRYDANNGITLCSECHYKFHRIYGHHNNTQDQIDDFTNSKVKRYAEQQGNELVEIIDKKQ